MNKKIISVLMGAAMLASSVPAMATTEGIIQGDVMLLSEDGEIENTYTGVVSKLEDGKVTVSINGTDVTFVLEEGVKAEDIAEGDTVVITSESPLETKDIKEATSIKKTDATADVLYTYTGVVSKLADSRVTVAIDGADVTFVFAEGIKTEDIAEGDTVEITSASLLNTKDIKEAATITKTTSAVKKEVNHSFNNYDAVVNEVKDGRINVTIEDDMVVSFVMTDDTAIYTIDGNKTDTVKAGDKVTVVSSSLLVTKDIKAAEAVIIKDGEDKASVYVDTFAKMNDEQLVSADGEIVLNMENAAKYDNKKLLVFYDFATMSIPAQTSPIKVVELGGKVTISFNVGSSIININGNKVEVEKPYVVGTGVTLVPIRVISESFGAEVTWNGETKTVKVVSAGTTIEIAIGSKTATVNGEKKELEEAPELTDGGFTMIPLRFISENLGAVVGYDSATQAVTVEK